MAPRGSPDRLRNFRSRIQVSVTVKMGILGKMGKLPVVLHVTLAIWQSWQPCVKSPIKWAKNQIANVMILAIWLAIWNSIGLFELAALVASNQAQAQYAQNDRARGRQRGECCLCHLIVRISGFSAKVVRTFLTSYGVCGGRGLWCPKILENLRRGELLLKRGIGCP